MPDPNTWTFTRPIGGTASFANHAAVLLSNGQVLIAGGTTGTLARLYDPLADAWQAVGSLRTPHLSDPTMTQLLNGKVLLVGGGVPELYDPSTGTWTQTAAMKVPRTEHTATLLPNGQVLVAGGLVNNAPVSSVEVYDPNANTWTSVGDMLGMRANHTATLMDNGPLVFLGGYQGTLDVNTSELYNYLDGRPLYPDRMQGGIPNMSNHTATAVPNGIVAVGGTDNPHLALFFNGIEWGMRATASHDHSHHTATLLSTGNVLVVGGGNSGSETSAVDLYNPSSDLWTPSSLSADSVAQLNVPRTNHTGTLLPNGRYLVIGGTGSITITPPPTQNPDGTMTVSSARTIVAGTTAEYYTPPAN